MLWVTTDFRFFHMVTVIVQLALESFFTSFIYSYSLWTEINSNNGPITFFSIYRCFYVEKMCICIILISVDNAIVPCCYCLRASWSFLQYEVSCSLIKLVRCGHKHLGISRIMIWHVSLSQNEEVRVADVLN